MRITVSVLLAFGLALSATCEPIQKREGSDSALNCVFEDNTIDCLRTRLARDLDQTEIQMTGKLSEPPLSAVMQQTGNFVAEVVDSIQNPEEEELEGQAGEQVEGRKKKFGKKKQRQLQKLLALAMVLKAKLSLIFQIIGTHFQWKAVTFSFLTLVINLVKFWMDLKNKQPPKVIYYEHAQHQHHYEHDDHDHGYWGRSSNDSPQDLAYSAHVPQN